MASIQCDIVSAEESIFSGSVKMIFVNHPEPPTQTYNGAPTIGDNCSGNIDIVTDRQFRRVTKLVFSVVVQSSVPCEILPENELA